MKDALRFFASLTDAQLLTEVEMLAEAQRDATATLIASLAELDSRRLYLDQGFPSLYQYCRERLRLSESAAYNRIEAARTARRFPIVLDLLAAGDVTMTTVTLLGKHLTTENHLQLLEAARHKSKREVQSQVAAIDPRPESPSRLIPLGGGRYQLEITLDEEGYLALLRLQELMRHTLPTGDPADIVAQALSRLLTHVERRALGKVRRPRSGLTVSATRYVPGAVRREVWRRDNGQCAFVGKSGRCPERSFLELHHVVPFAKGGTTRADNLQLRCRAHNQYEAELSGAGAVRSGSTIARGAAAAAPESSPDPS